MREIGRGFPSVGRGALNLPYTPKWGSAVQVPVSGPQSFLGPKAAHLPHFINDLPHMGGQHDGLATAQPSGWKS